MQAAPIIAAVVGLAGTYMSYKSQSEAAAGQKDAARDAARISELNARTQERETARELTNLKSQQEREEAQNRAKAAASGVAVGEGSFGLVLEDQKKTNQERRGWLKESGKNKANIIRQGGQSSYDQGMAMADQTKSGGFGTLIGGAKDLYGTGTSAGWW